MAASGKIIEFVTKMSKEAVVLKIQGEPKSCDEVKNLLCSEINCFSAFKSYFVSNVSQLCLISLEKNGIEKIKLKRLLY